jgi:hypothetical protein
MSQGAAFSAGELTSAYEHASHPYQGERLSMGAEVITPTTERNVRQRQETIAIPNDDLAMPDSHAPSFN